VIVIIGRMRKMMIYLSKERLNFFELIPWGFWWFLLKKLNHYSWG
jgi:hypothetical protein